MKCKGKTTTGNRCTRNVSGRKKYCFQHGPKAKNKRRKKQNRNRKYKHRRRNPDFENIFRLYTKVVGELNRLCQKYQCRPSDCFDVCSTRGLNRRYRHYRRHRTRRRRRNPWSRPLSARTARSWLGEEYYPPVPKPKPAHNILIIGGDDTYIPDWMRQFRTAQIHQIDVDLKQQLGDFKPDLILMFVKADKPFRPTRHTIYKAKTYSNETGIPYITVHKGWSHVMMRANELGLDWFSQAYPHPLYVPEEDLKPKPKRKMTKAKLAHDKKRAERFHARGITSKDVNYARARYVLEEPSECTLCDTKIKYQFRLMFDRPGEHEPINFYPVGSVCITDWMDALPDSEGKLALYAQLKEEMEKVEAIQRKKRKKSSAAAKQRRKAQSDAIKKREAARKAKLAARKEQRKKERASKKKTIKKKTKKKKSTGRLKKKFEDTQTHFGWEDED